MAVIGIDSHKDTLAGCLVDDAGRPVEHRSIPNCADGHAELVAWAHPVGVERVGIEGSGNYGRPAAQALIAAGVTVAEVPPQMTAAARRGRRTGTKSDRVDALEIARIAARDHDLPAPRFAGAPEGLACVVAPKDTPTTSDASTAARPNEKPSAPSNGASQTASGHTSKPTSNTPNPTPA